MRHGLATRTFGIVAVMVMMVAATVINAASPGSTALTAVMVIALLLYGGVVAYFPLPFFIKVPLIVAFLRFFFVPFLVKPIIGQPLADNFHAVDVTVVAILVATLAMCLVYAFASFLFARNPVDGYARFSITETQTAGVVLFAIGAAAFIGSIVIEAIARKLDPTAANPLTQLRSALILGAVMLFVCEGIRRGAAVIKSPVVMAVVAATIVLSVLANGRSYMAIVAIGFVLATQATGRRYRLVYMVPVLAVGFAILMAITPFFMVVRDLTTNSNTSPAEVTKQIFQEWVENPDAVAGRYAENLTGWKTTIYRPIWNVFGIQVESPTSRFAMVGHMDAIISRFGDSEFMGLTTVNQALQNISPNIGANKLVVQVGDLIYWRGGLELTGVRGAATATPMGEGYAAFGIVGVFLYTLILQAILVVVAYVSMRYDMSFGLYAITIMFNSFIEGDSHIVLDLAVRQIPELMLLHFIVILVCRRWLIVSRGGLAPRGGNGLNERLDARGLPRRR